MGGSSGGGSSGAVSYPAYMQDQHTSWLTAVAGLITTATTGDSPFATAVAYDPDCVLNATNYIISQFNTAVVALAPATTWGSSYTTVAAKYTPTTLTAISDFTFPDIFTTSAVATTVSAFQADLEARRDNSIKPSYKVGALNINAVNSSAFVIGDALITAEVARDVAKFSGEMYFQNEEKLLRYTVAKAEENTAHNANILKKDAITIERDVNDRNFNLQGTAQILDGIAKQIGFYQAVAQVTADANRIKIVAKSEENSANYEYDAKDATWDLEMYSYGSNMMASISGGTTGGSKGASKIQSALGGALSGAAAGSMIAPGIGTGIGAVVGGLAGLLG